MSWSVKIIIWKNVFLYFTDIQSEILSWAVVLLIVVVCFAVMQLVKPMLQKKKSTIQVVKSIKAFYYEVYKKNGLKKLEPWN